MRILLVTDLYPIENSSEPSTIKNFALKWQEQGHIVDVIRPNFVFNTLLRKRKIFPEKTYFENNITIYNVNCITPFLFDVTKKLPKDFKIGNYNLVISHMPSGAMFAMKLIGKCAGIPYAVSVHSSDIKVLTKPLYKFFFSTSLQKAYKRADAISARSAVLAERIKELSPYAVNKTFVAFSGADKNIIESQEFFEEKAKTEQNPLIITTTAKLIKRKNTDVIIKAISKIKDFNFVLKVIGSGGERQNLENLVKDLKLEDKVIFTGHLPNSEVLENLKHSSVFVLLSREETFGMVYLEAAAKGNIVIATENDGIDGVLTNGKNCFTCPADENKLADLICKIKNLSAERRQNLLTEQRKYLLENDDNKAGENYLSEIFRLCGI